MSRLLFSTFESAAAPTAVVVQPFGGLLNSIARFSTGTYSVTRTSLGAYVNGRVLGGQQTAFQIAASVQPFGGHELKVLPEGQRADDVRVIYTSTPLVTITPTTTPDQISIEGDSYVVFRVEGPWTMSGRTSYTVYAARQRVP